MILKIKKSTYKIKGLEFFGIIITTRKQLENANVKLYIGEKKWK